MRPVVGVGRAFVVFQQQRHVEIAGVESFGNKIPVLNHGFHKPLYILLRSEALCFGQLTTAPYLRQKFAWWDCARAADQRRDESVQLFQISWSVRRGTGQESISDEALAAVSRSALPHR